MAVRGHRLLLGLIATLLVGIAGVVGWAAADDEVKRDDAELELAMRDNARIETLRQERVGSQAPPLCLFDNHVSLTIVMPGYFTPATRAAPP